MTGPRYEKLAALGVDFDYIGSPTRMGSSAPKLIANWHANYRELRKYKQQNGHLPASRSKLGRWLENNKASHKKGKLPKDRQEMLAKLGVELESVSKDKDDKWDRRLKELEDHLECSNDVPNQPLDRWVSKQRALLKQGKLPPGRVKKLTEAGFGLVEDASSVASECSDESNSEVDATGGDVASSEVKLTTKRLSVEGAKPEVEGKRLHNQPELGEGLVRRLRHFANIVCGVNRKCETEKRAL